MVVLMLRNSMGNLDIAITRYSCQLRRRGAEGLMDQNDISELTAGAVMSLLAGVCWEKRGSSFEQEIYCYVHDRLNRLK